MKASVILPVYNGAKFLKQSIESILNQSFKDFEFIIIDDGSKDNSLEIIKSYAKNNKKIKLIIHKKNQGLVKTLNEGIQKSKSDLIIRMDQDDESLPNRIKTQCEFMDKNPDITIAGSFVYHMGATPKDDRLIILPTDPAEIKHKLLLDGNNPIYHPSVIMRKQKILKLGGYRSEFKNCEDYDLWIRAAKKHKIANIDAPLLRYRITLGGMTFSKKWEQFYYVFLALEANKNPGANFRKISLLAQKNLKKYNQKKFLWDFYTNSLKEFISLKRFSEACILTKRISKEIGYFKSIELFTEIIKSAIQPDVKTKEIKSNTKNILFAVPYLVLGGASKRFEIISKMLKNNKYKVSFISTVPVDEKLLSDISSQFEPITPDIFNLPKLLQNNDDWKKFIFYVLNSRKIGTILLGGSQYFYELLPEIKHKFPYIKIVDQQFNTGCHFINNRKYAKYIDHTIAENEEIFSKLKNDYLENPKKITLIHNGVNIKEFSRENKKIQKTPTRIPKNKFIISFLGRLSEEKGPDIFVDIAAQFEKNKNVFFVLAGDGPQKEQCQKIIRQKKLKNIFMPGIIDSKQYLKITDLLLVTSRLDGRPNAILEGTSMSVPVISLSVGGIPKMIVNNVNGFLCQNISEIIDKINLFITDKQKLDELKNSSREYAVKNFDENLNITKYLKILQ